MQPVRAPRWETTVVRRNRRTVILGNRKTSLSLEPTFWHALKSIAAAQQTSMAHLVARIDSERLHANLTSAVRLFILNYYRDRCRSERSD